MKYETKGEKIFQAVNYVILLLVVLVTLYPFWNIVMQSFSSTKYINAGSVSFFPRGFNVKTYATIMSDSYFWTTYKNTVIYTVVGTLISVFLTTIFAYSLSRMHRKQLSGTKFFSLMAVITMFFGGGLIPSYLVVNNLGMTNTMWAIVIPGALSIFNLLIMKSFFDSLPAALEEAAEIDGYSTYSVLWKIIIPVSKPIIATMVLFYAVAAWNSWFSAFIYLDKQNLYPVTMYLRNLIAGASQQSDAAASSADSQMQISANIKSVAMFLSVLPILLVYPFVQKYFVTGVMLGSVKG
jgi:putative aldouronate transport system permease protein